MKGVLPFGLLLSLATAISIPSLAKRQANSGVASSTFRRRAYHSSGVLDNWLYIDGGEFSYASGNNVVYQYSSSLLAIDLRSDWTNSTVNIHANSKPSGVPDLTAGSLWVDKGNKVLYSGFSGRKSTFGNDADQPYGLWSFAPDGQGGGTWKNLNGTADAGFQSQPRPFSPLVASGNGAGFMLGGFAVNSSSSDPRNNAITISGLVSYNFTTNKLSNTTVSGISNGGMIQMGGAHFVPNFGSNGIMVTWGGDQVGKVQADSDAFVDSSKVQIFDAASGSWYEQATTGNTPEARKEFCMTGAASDNNTYEIFVYGGWNGNLGGAAIPFDEVFVLSLPSFNWFKADYPAENPRHGLTCQAASGGQIITIGGVNTTTNGPNNLYNDVFDTPDQFTQGLGVFDLNTMAWSSGYSSKQTRYKPASALQQYYSTNPRQPTYASDGLKQVMAVQNFNASNSGSGSSGSGSSGSGENRGSSSSGSNAGAIAGGVVGGIAALAIIAGLAFFFMRRSKRKQVGTAQATNEGYFPQEMPGQASEKHELTGSHPTSPMPRYAKYSDVPPTQTSRPHYDEASEMPANEHRHELA